MKQGLCIFPAQAGVGNTDTEFRFLSRHNILTPFMQMRLNHHTCDAVVTGCYLISNICAHIDLTFELLAAACQNMKKMALLLCKPEKQDDFDAKNSFCMRLLRLICDMTLASGQLRRQLA